MFKIMKNIVLCSVVLFVAGFKPANYKSTIKNWIPKQQTCEAFNTAIDRMCVRLLGTINRVILFK